MKSLLFDTDAVSYFLKGYPAVRDFVASASDPEVPFRFTLITYYEILSGLLHRDARKQLTVFEAFAETCRILPLTRKSIFYSAELYAELRLKGTPVDDIDLLIAGVALEHDFTLVTNNLKHFGKIKGLDVHHLALSP